VSFRRVFQLSIVVGLVASGCVSEGHSRRSVTEPDVVVTGGVRPTYSWGSGRAFSITVARTTAPASIVWGVADPDHALDPPIVHGRVPDGTVESAATERVLSSGTEYLVTVTLADGRTGWKEFRP
jgi:hypothetical protein